MAWRCSLLLAILVAVFAAAGCAGTPHAPATATAEQGSGQQYPPVPFAGAPKVSSPLPEFVLAGDPCADALMPEQVKVAIGVTVPGRRIDTPALGPACAWNNHGTGGAVGVSYVLNTHVGLSGVYANTKPRAGLWRELPPIQGFPAVAHAGGKGEKVPAGFCQASVGLADSFSIDVNLSLGESKKYAVDACNLVSQVADMAITSLRVKAGL